MPVKNHPVVQVILALGIRVEHGRLQELLVTEDEMQGIDQVEAVIIEVLGGPGVLAQEDRQDDRREPGPLGARVVDGMGRGPGLIEAEPVTPLSHVTLVIELHALVGLLDVPKRPAIWRHAHPPPAR